MREALYIIFILILIYYLYSRFGYDKIYINNRHWNVADYDNKAEAAKLLARVNEKLIGFMRYLKEKYHIDETADVIANADHNHELANSERAKLIDSLLDGYNPDMFFENDPRYSSSTSYTINKGASMYICLRDRDNPNNLVSEDVLLFTMLHEMSHIANYSGWGHDRYFWIVFKFILHEAYISGYYTPVDYSKYPVTFCGLRVNYNPFYDGNLPLLQT